MTFRFWGESYFATKVDPEKHAGGVEREKRSFKTLETFFGGMLLADIKRTKIMEYRAKRLAEPIIRRGKPALFNGKTKTVSFVTVNRELAFLRFLLNLAEDDGLIEQAPKFKGKGGGALIRSEKSRKRDRVASYEEYQAILGNMQRHAQRVLIAQYESAMRPGEAIRLPWDFVDLKADNGAQVRGFIRLPDWYVKEKKKRTVPISPALRAVLDELRAEQKKVASISNRVFTRNGRPIKSIRTIFEVALEKAKIEDLRLHDFRHTCITRWSAEGIPQQAIMAAAGHHSIAQNNDYVNMKRRTSQKHLQNCNAIVT